MPENKDADEEPLGPHELVFFSVPDFAGKHFHPSYSAWQCNPFLHKQECNLWVQVTTYIISRTCGIRHCLDSQRSASEEHPQGTGREGCGNWCVFKQMESHLPRLSKEFNLFGQLLREQLKLALKPFWEQQGFHSCSSSDGATEGSAPQAHRWVLLPELHQD